MRKSRSPFVKPSDSKSWYDIFEDWALIESSFAQQYGIRLRREDEMTWDEFATLLAGLNGETPLGHIVSIRAESDKEKLKKFTPEEKRIRNEWRRKHREIVTDKAQYEGAMNNFAAIFKALSEEGG